MIDNIKFWICTELLKFYLRRRDFDRVNYYLNRKKELIPPMREVAKDINLKRKEIKVQMVYKLQEAY